MFFLKEENRNLCESETDKAECIREVEEAKEPMNEDQPEGRIRRGSHEWRGNSDPRAHTNSEKHKSKHKDQNFLILVLALALAFLSILSRAVFN